MDVYSIAFSYVIKHFLKYLLTALYNAPVSINSHYAAQVNHDLYG